MNEERERIREICKEYHCGFHIATDFYKLETALLAARKKVAELEKENRELRNIATDGLVLASHLQEIFYHKKPSGHFPNSLKLLSKEQK